MDIKFIKYTTKDTEFHCPICVDGLTWEQVTIIVNDILNKHKDNLFGIYFNTM